VNRRIDLMTWPEIRRHLSAGRDTIVVAFGATEQHGPHLPLATDTLLGDELAARVAEQLDALVAPTIAIGCSSHHHAFAGTLSLTDSTFSAIVGDMVESFARSAFRRAVLLPSHGGNFAPLAAALAAVPQYPDLHVDALCDLSLLANLPVHAEREEGIAVGEGGLHGGEWETSLLLASDPDSVRMSDAEPGYVGSPDEALAAVFDHGVHTISSNGVIGDPRSADRERGERYWAYITTSVLDVLGGDASD
jgi:creatinine amidohydrolase